MRALRPALEKLTKLDYLDLFGTCGDVQRRSTQCARVGGKVRGETRTSGSGGLSRLVCLCGVTGLVAALAQVGIRI